MNKIYLKGANNARDFGGIKNAEGKVIKENFFLRSNALHKINKKDIETLRSHNLKTIIDLRTNVETSDKPDVKIDGVEIIHIPIYAEEVIGITHEKNRDPIKMLDNLPDMSDLYRTIVTSEDCVKQLKKAFDVITDPEREGAVLWHCSEGKDRCGIVSALFLLLMDVSREEVFTDFLITNISATKKAKLLGSLTYLVKKDKALAKQVYEIFLAEEEYLTAALQSIDEKWGGTESFIKNQLGVSDETKALMKKKFLE